MNSKLDDPAHGAPEAGIHMSKVVSMSGDERVVGPLLPPDVVWRSDVWHERGTKTGPEGTPHENRIEDVISIISRFHLARVKDLGGLGCVTRSAVRGQERGQRVSH